MFKIQNFVLISKNHTVFYSNSKLNLFFCNFNILLLRILN